MSGQGAGPGGARPLDRGRGTPGSHDQTIEVLRSCVAGPGARRRRVLAPEGPLEGYRPAAVALLLRNHGGWPQLPLIVRASGLSAHSGQIALPGGVRDPDDESFAACARRETWEELGVAGDRIDVIGMLDDVPTPTGFIITPVVAELRGAVEYRANPAEVSEVFEAPLAAFADPSAAEDLGERRTWGLAYRVRAYSFGGHRIWGATARVLESLHEVLAGPGAAVL